MYAVAGRELVSALASVMRLAASVLTLALVFPWNRAQDTQDTGLWALGGGDDGGCDMSSRAHFYLHYPTEITSCREETTAAVWEIPPALQDREVPDWQTKLISGGVRDPPWTSIAAQDAGSRTQPEGVTVISSTSPWVLNSGWVRTFQLLTPGRYGNVLKI